MRLKTVAISVCFRAFAAMSVAAIIQGCEKEIDFKYHDIEPVTVIEGALSQTGGCVSITMTTPMDEPMNTNRITDAEVVLTDVTDGKPVELTVDESGDFVSDQGGVAGHTYELCVRRAGHMFTSRSTMAMPTEVTGMQFQWIKMPYDYVAVLQVTFTDNPKQAGDCYWVRIYRNGEPYHWSVVNDDMAVAGRVDEVIMTSRKDLDKEEEDEALRDGDVVSARVAPIGREMFDYLSALTSGGNNGPRMFEGDFCLGYFLAAPVAEGETVFHPDDLSVFE